MAIKTKYHTSKQDNFTLPLNMLLPDMIDDSIFCFIFIEMIRQLREKKTRSILYVNVITELLNLMLCVPYKVALS